MNLKKYLFKKERLDLVFILIIFVFLFIIQHYSLMNQEIYSLEWYYLSTPIGLLHAELSDNNDFSNWLIYLKEQTPVIEQSNKAILLSWVLILFSFIFLFIKRLEFRRRNEVE